MERHIIPAAGFDLAVNTAGNPNAERLAVVLPGKLDSKDYPHMTSLVRSLAGPDRFVACPDSPGIWESSGTPADYTINNCVAAVHDLVRHYGDRPTTAIGHSMGGKIAMLALAENDAIEAAASFGTRMGGEPLTSLSLSGVVMHTRPLPEVLRPGHAAAAVELSDDASPDADMAPVDDGPAERQFALPYGFFRQAAACQAVDKLQGCRKLKLVGYGSQDTVATPARVIEAYNRLEPSKRLFRIAAGHDYYNQPQAVEDFNTTIGRLLARYGV